MFAWKNKRKDDSDDDDDFGLKLSIKFSAAEVIDWI